MLESKGGLPLPTDNQGHLQSRSVGCALCMSCAPQSAMDRQWGEEKRHGGTVESRKSVGMRDQISVT